MLKKLRRKFVMTNMLLVSLVLIIVFGLLIGSNNQHIIQQSQAAMRGALAWSKGFRPPRLEISGAPRPVGDWNGEGDRQTAIIPVFSVTINRSGTVTEVNDGDRVQVSDDVAAQAAEEALHTDSDSGTLSGLDLRYIREQAADGSTHIAFADRSWERSSLRNLLLSCLLVFATALACFFFISLALAKLALRPVELAWKQQRRFVADASHELKTPLTVILTNAGLVLSHPDDTVREQSKWIRYIQEEAQRMRGLVEDLLFLAKNDEGRMNAVPFQAVNLSQLTKGVLLTFEPVAFEAGADLTDSVTPGLIVSGHSDQLRRLVAILLDNAVKYAGPAGKVHVYLDRSERNMARLAVQNTGSPIPPEHLSHLFERFYRADDSRARTSGGYGLGLAIAKSIAEGHHGSISVRSNASEGTAFTVLLPERAEKSPAIERL
ncbi:MAG: HAMP domain-containing histidine kinase [Intestinimonas sp.]|jgi:signal transduction histidine kinase|nr:HAMP domain-containing histidine kinase [Intestinimonas sp.]